MNFSNYQEDLEVAIKVVIVGNGAVGKSSMIQRYCKGVFTKSYKKTIGVDFLEKQLRILGHDVRLMLWDTAGQEEFDAITKAYYRGAQACVVAFSTPDRNSFEAVPKWKRKVEEECQQIPMVLVQNKIDLMHQSVVSDEEVEEMANNCQMRLYRTSVKEDINICNVFQHLAEDYVTRVRSSNLFPNFSSRFSSFDHFESSDFGSSRRFYLNSEASTSSSSSSSSTSSNCSDPTSSSAVMSSPFRIVSPQEYLDNPMFEAINQNKGRSLIKGNKVWNSSKRMIFGGGSGPSSNISSQNVIYKKNIHKKLMLHQQPPYNNTNSSTTNNNMESNNNSLPPFRVKSNCKVI